jgi:hypothetical protein
MDHLRKIENCIRALELGARFEVAEKPDVIWPPTLLVRTRFPGEATSSCMTYDLTRTPAKIVLTNIRHIFGHVRAGTFEQADIVFADDFNALAAGTLLEGAKTSFTPDLDANAPELDRALNYYRTHYAAQAPSLP